MRIHRLHLLFAALLVVHGQAAWAAASAQFWPAMKESFFAGKTIEDAPFIKIDAPARAESGAQVPMTLTIDQPLDSPAAIRKVYVLVDANPIQLTAIYHFTPLSGKAQIETRIRVETDSYVRAIGETADGRLYMAYTEVRAAGGCSGPPEANMANVRTNVGKIRMNVAEPVKLGEVNTATFHIKHPMLTGLQRDLASGGYWPAFFINKATFTYNGKLVLDANFAIGISENPYLRFHFVPDAPGKLEVKAVDNEGQLFEHAVEVKL